MPKKVRLGQKQCPECGKWIKGPRTKVCPKCSYEFPFKQKETPAAEPEAAVAEPAAAVPEMAAKPGNVITLGQIKAVSRMVKTIGGFRRLHEMLEIIRGVGGARKFQDLLDAMAVGEGEEAQP
jgi:hypothetical protein